MSDYAGSLEGTSVFLGSGDSDPHVPFSRVRGVSRGLSADLRTGFVDTDREHLMVIWRKPLSDAAKEDLVERVAKLGAF